MMNHLKQNSQQEKPGTTNNPDNQEESFLDFLIPEAKQPTDGPSLFEFLGHLFPPKPRDQTKERYDPALFWVDVVRSAARQPTEPDKAFFIKSNRTIH